MPFAIQRCGANLPSAGGLLGLRTLGSAPSDVLRSADLMQAEALSSLSAIAMAAGGRETCRAEPSHPAVSLHSPPRTHGHPHFLGCALRVCNFHVAKITDTAYITHCLDWINGSMYSLVTVIPTEK